MGVVTRILVVQLLLSLVYISNASFNYDFEIDQISGRLVKPANMSEDLFELAKFFRIKETLEGLKPEKINAGVGRTGRVRRDAGDKRSFGTTMPGLINQGFYKQNSVVLNKLASAQSSITQDSTFYIERFYTYNGEDFQGTIKFKYLLHSREIMVLAKREGDSSFTMLSRESGRKGFEDFEMDQEVTDIAYGNNPQSDYHFVCVTVDSKEMREAYPRNGSDVMDVNKEIVPADKARSRVFQFVIRGTPGGWYTYHLANQFVIDTYAAMDAEFWNWDGRLFLGIAHIGNLQTQVKTTENLIWVQDNPDNPNIKKLDGFEGFENYAGSAVKHHVLQSVSYVFFVNAEEYDGKDPKTTFHRHRSPIYSYNYETKSYSIAHSLPTFAPKDAAVMSILDPYPIHNKHFLVYPNTKEVVNNQVIDLPAIIFSLVRGKFIPFQSLDLNMDVTSVFTYDDLPDEGQLNKMFIFFSAIKNKIKFFQFDGSMFVEITDVAINLPAFDSAVWSGQPQFWDNKLYLNEATVEFTFEGAFDFSNEQKSHLDHCMSVRRERRENRDSERFSQHIDTFPTKAAWNSAKPLVLEQGLAFNGHVNIASLKAEVRAEAPSDHVEIYNMTRVDAEFVRKVTDLKEEVAKQKNDTQMIVDDRASNSYLECGANNLTVDLQVHNVTANEVTGGKLYKGEVDFNLATSSGNAKMSLHDLEEEIVVIAGANMTQEFITQNVTAANIKINGGYGVDKLNGKPVRDYVQVSDSLIFVKGRTTFTQGAKFDSLTVGSIENTTFEASKLLLRTGNQEFTDTPAFSAVHFHDLKAERINNVDLTIIEKSYNYKDNRLGFVEPLTVSHLEVSGNVEANIGILDSQGNVMKHIDLHEIDDYALKKNGTRQLIKVPHHFAKLVANRIVNNNQTINKKQWPEEFVGIRSEQSHPSLHHTTNIYLGDAEFSSLTVKSKIVDNQDQAEILVDNGALDIALLNSPNTFTGHKTIKNIGLQKNSEVTSQTVFGMNMPTLNSYVSNAEIPFTAPLTLSDQLQLNGEVSLGDVGLGPNGAIYTINEINQPVLSNLSTLYSDGIRRNVSALPDLVSSISYAAFEKDLSVTTLDGLSPKSEYLRLSGASPRSLSNVRFMDEVKFTKDIAQSENSTVKTCREHISKAPFCKIDANGDCCRKNSEELCQCEIKNGKCVVKSNVHDLEVCNEIVLHELTYVHQGSLKVTGDTRLAKNVEFLGGFSADKLSVTTDDCHLNGIKCDNIASRIHPEIFTAGLNKFGNTIASVDDIAISQALIVGTNINTVDVNNMYSDSLLINGPATNLPETLTLQNRAEVDKFTSNGVNIGNTPVDDLLNRTNHVVNKASSNPTSICGKLGFKKKLETKHVKSPEIDSVDTLNFFSNFWTKKEQNITGDITVENADFKDKLLANKKDSSLSTINMVDLVNLNKDAVRIDDSKITLKDVHFDVAQMLHESGLTVKNQFLGLDTSKIVAKENANTTVVVNGDKTFKNPVHVDGNVELSESTWKSADANSSVNIDKFIEFQDNSRFSKVEFKKNLKLTHEVKASTVNRESLTSLRDTKVFANANNSLAFDIAFSTVEAQDKVVTNAGFQINNKNLDYWKANYVSLSKNNTITGQHKFSAGLEVEGILQATHIHHKNANNKEKLIKTDGLSINLAELNRRALFKDEPHTNISNTLKIPTATVNGDVITDLVNNVDLAETALDYVSSKTMVNVSLNGNLEAAAVSTNVMEFPVSGMNDQSYQGVEVSAGIMTVTISRAESNAVLKSSDDVTFSARKTFSGTTTIANLTANKVQNFRVGTCTNPTILLTDSCNNKAQVIKGNVSFGANVDVTNLAINTMTVNNKNLTTLGEKSVLRSETGEIVFTGSKTVQQLNISGSSSVTLNDKVFDLQVDTIVQSALQSIALTDQPTDMSSVVRQISSESYEVPSAFVYSAIQVPSEGNYKLHPLAAGPNPTSFRVLGFSATDGVRVYNLPTDMTQTSSELTHAFGQMSYRIATDEVKSYTQTDGNVVVFANFREKNKENNVMCLGTFVVSDSKATKKKCLKTRNQDPKEGAKDPLKPYAFTTVQLGEYPGFAVAEKNWGDDSQSVLSLKLDGDGVNNWMANKNKIWFNDTGINLRIESSRTPEDVGSSSAPTILAVGSRDKGELHILKGTSREDLAYVQKMRVQFGTLFKLFSWNDETYIAMIAPERDDNRLVIAKFESNQFKLFQMLVVEKPMDLSWYIHNGHLFVRVLFGDHIKSRVKSFKLKGTMFEESPDSQIQLSGVESYTELCRSCNTTEAQMIVTMGSATSSRLNQFRGVPVNSVHRFMYKDNEVAKYREEYKNKDPAIPKFYTMDCHNMVGWYVKKLHETNDLSVGGFTYQDAGSMLLQLMPRRYVHYRPIDCHQKIGNVLKDPKFKDLLDKPLPNGVANLYPYTNNGRDLNNYLGSVHIYQEADGVFYTFTRLNNSFVSQDAVHAISFHASCDPNDGTTYNAESFHYNSTNSSPNKPFAKNSGDHLQQCAVYHDVDSGLSNRLKSLDNKSVAGAVVIHKRLTSSSQPFQKPVDSVASRLGCGYIKHPEQAQFQYTQDHGDTLTF